MGSSRLVKRIADQLKQKIHTGELPKGSHLGVQKIADQYEVSRSPSREALVLLASEGYLTQERNRGFFVNEPPQTDDARSDEILSLEEPEEYYRLSEDWLNGEIPSEVTEQFLQKRYDLTKFQVIDILNIAARVGWAEPKPGYGWRLLEVAKTRETLEQIYKVRALIEPAALLEPSFHHDFDVLNALTYEQHALLGGDIERLPADVLIKMGVKFHEDLTALSGNALYSMILVKVNKMRRLVEYRAMIDRTRFYNQAKEHLQILDLVKEGNNLEAAHLIKKHLSGSFAMKSPILKFND